MTRHSNQLIGKSKDIIETELYKMSLLIPDGFNNWDHVKAVCFKQVSRRAHEISKSGRSTLDELVNCYQSLERFFN